MYIYIHSCPYIHAQVSQQWQVQKMVHCSETLLQTISSLRVGNDSQQSAQNLFYIVENTSGYVFKISQTFVFQTIISDASVWKFS